MPGGLLPVGFVIPEVIFDLVELVKFPEFKELLVLFCPPILLARRIWRKIATDKDIANVDILLEITKFDRIPLY